MAWGSGLRWLKREEPPRAQGGRALKIRRIEAIGRGPLELRLDNVKGRLRRVSPTGPREAVEGFDESGDHRLWLCWSGDGGLSG